MTERHTQYFSTTIIAVAIVKLMNDGGKCVCVVGGEGSKTLVVTLYIYLTNW